MDGLKKAVEKWFGPLLLPLWTAIPVEVWLLLKKPPFSGVEVTMVIMGILFLVFAGTVETAAEEPGSRVFGFLYLLAAVFFAAAGLYRWLF
ncbi:hypothetical protein JF544_12105 [Halobacillus kuroshimensis]|uniref:Uncharacterized protein n=1 Tax=Halobacillus kuroshimensis TaxID=302481 RepID=A0ABS3DXD1_9BACI|nr:MULTISPECIES: hypothetical protein [Halobacillus]MBN8235999.1 hypothetical protein [Halobacillus kuroshimensis]